ncbi:MULTISPECIES: NAD-dependent succinate-semialdehyde dehydrogenase [Rhodomicrobium]|uniref:NAD-dependent succinate-semialdehyde dehydrogenase n=1 Tax=Rhodomicrobium TaxID=1068 RepID=UPI000B4B2EFE|nr:MULTISPECIES: NAD-dependent succinate-semialdehyde dehydrogenase [Rhodomicrobium]
MKAINPATGELVAEYEETSAADAIAMVEAADRAFHDWRRLSFAERAVPMRKAAQILHDRAQDYARLMTQEMGKPITGGVAEVEKCASACEYFADHAEEFLAREPVPMDGAKSFVTFQPLGVVLAIMPWNFPFWQVFRFIAPGIMAGNAGVLKHASNVPGCALAIEEVMRDAGFPKDLFRALLIGSKAIDGLIEHPKVRAVTLTGSEGAGRSVARKAGEVLKKAVLELGGSDPYLVLEDADVEKAAAICTKARLVNSGQSCIAGKRFIVIESLRDQFEQAFVAKMQAAKMGDPMDAATEVGPLARHDLREDLHKQVEASIDKGARVLCGGKIPDGPGAYYPPTVLTDVVKGMPAHDEELFGPVAAVIVAEDEADAIRIANDSNFGLGGGVITPDLARGERLAAEFIEAGSVFVNAQVASHPKLPFGGIKHSGYGRELSHYGIKEFVNIKTVFIAN